MWDGMKIITSCSSKRGAPIKGDVGKANQLNNFFNRFDNPISSSVQITTSSMPLPSSSLSLSSQDTQETVPPPTITAAQVQGELRRICTSKAAGPD